MTRRHNSFLIWWSTVDQGLSSLSNFLPFFFAARSIGASEIGELALAVSLLNISVLSGRGIWLDYFGRCRDQISDLGAQVRSTALIMGVVLPIPIVGLGWLIESDVLSILGLFLPVVLLQDSSRCVMINSDHPVAAAVNDGLWFVVTVVLSVVGPTESATWLAASWGFGGLAGAMLGLFQLPFSLNWSLNNVLQITRNAKLLIVDEFFQYGLLLLLMIALASVDKTSAGIYRVGTLLFTPAQIVFTATPLWIGAVMRTTGRTQALGLRNLLIVLSPSAIAVTLNALAVFMFPPILRNLAPGLEGDIEPLEFYLTALTFTVAASFVFSSLSRQGFGSEVRLAARIAISVIAVITVLIAGSLDTLKPMLLTLSLLFVVYDAYLLATVWKQNPHDASN